jgi:hypothetical protein
MNRASSSVKILSAAHEEIQRVHQGNFFRRITGNALQVSIPAHELPRLAEKVDDAGHARDDGINQGNPFLAITLPPASPTSPGRQLAFPFVVLSLIYCFNGNFSNNSYCLANALRYSRSATVPLVPNVGSADVRTPITGSTVRCA